MSPRASFFALALVTLLSGACRRAEIASYRVPKEKEAPEEKPEPASPSPVASPVATAGATMAGTPVTTADGPGLSWTTPASWKLKPAAPMRKASYAVPGDGGEAELSITAFPNNVGGETANLNRWRDQVKLAPLSEQALAETVTRFTANDLSFTVADFSNPQAPAPGPQHILGAIVPFAGATWFFKVSGADATVASVKLAFIEFLKSVKAASPAASPATP